ncbi:alpha,alpha-trehalase TreF [Frateuria sp. STR12]|uniref:alpha,alpha-trehalase TreF n=1 Tax=Frateuria hangzhouensis TaxID=2995589 RepID=UPI002260CDCB|nr:alpha,alpha-trehalase TreF [Frateuria sp. STR12]MCX7512531.1 alpha,alpha-trehalase TreF [Frateuria sp. STR12]
MTDETKRQNEEKAASVPKADTLTPADRYQELFVDVQMGGVFADSKTFVDCVPRGDPEDILECYREKCDDEGFDLAGFVDTHFEPPTVHTSNYKSPPGQSLKAHIDSLWDVLTRHPRQHPPNSSILPLPNDYVVPGGRFAELYYWDSYFTMLGLAESGRHDLVASMADNFAYLIDTYGHVPNGNRTYYLSRSQPPVFALMVELFEDCGVHKAIEYLPRLRKEYNYWMAGAEDMRPGDTRGRCVSLDDGSILNRYWDDRDSPREESYHEDVATARQSSRAAHEVYRELRAGAESGWDFSSRWCDGTDLSTIRTSSILPVDLNCFLFKLERQICLLNHAAGQSRQAEKFRQRAVLRKKAIERLLWNDQAGAFFDFDWARDAPREALNSAAATPLFVGLASREQARRTADALHDRLLSQGGLGTSESLSGQQWDQPNGWAPLQWMAIRGLRNYDIDATDIACRWLRTVGTLYKSESKLVEKYVITHDGENAEGGGGGEYPLQDGFGWTNGVTRRLLHEDPANEANEAKAASKP